MEIKLISKETYKVIKNLYDTYPNLTYENTGYDGIANDRLGPHEIGAIGYIEMILKQYITGFVSFQNFRTRGSDIQIRFQYNYNADNPNGGIPFTGVGYIMLDELLNGFKSK